MKLKAKLFWVVFVGVVVGVLTLNIVLSAIGAAYDNGYAPDELTELALEAESRSNELPELSASTIIGELAKKHPRLVFDWFDQQGSLLYSSEAGRTAYSSSELLARSANKPPDEYHLSKAYDIALNGDRGVLTITAGPGNAQTQFVILYFREPSVFLVYLVPVLLFMFAPALAAVLLFVSVNRRISRLNAAMNATDLSGTSLVLSDDSKDEIGQLSRRFQGMADKIRTQFERIRHAEEERRRLVSGLSHNLRTPLTTIVGYADSLNRELYRSPSERRQWISILLTRSQYMERLLKQLFRISLSDRESSALSKEECDIYELLRAIVADYVPILEDRGMEADIHIPEEKLVLQLDIGRIEQAIRNLVDNAVAYGASGNYIGLRASSDGSLFSLSVVDKGKGVPKDEQSAVFERFYRARAEVTGGSGGTGLGLAIATEFVEAHGGTVRLRSEPGTYTEFTIVLPVYPKD